MEIGKILLDARVADLKQPPVMMEQAFLQLVKRFFQLLQEKNVDYLLVGGLALLNYVEGRNTKDVDLILSVTEARKIKELEIQRQESDFMSCKFHDLKVDLLLTKNRLFSYVKTHCVDSLNYEDLTIPCASVAGLLLLKFYALPSLYRQGDFRQVNLYESDLSLLLYYHRETVDIDHLFKILSKHLLPTDLQEIRRIYSEMIQRIERFPRS